MASAADLGHLAHKTERKPKREITKTGDRGGAGRRAAAAWQTPSHAIVRVWLAVPLDTSWGNTFAAHTSTGGHPSLRSLDVIRAH